MRQTLTLVGILRSITLRGGYREGSNDRWFEAQMIVREDHPGTSSLHPVDAIVDPIELPEHAAVFQARPGDRVELVGYWGEFDCALPSGDVLPSLFFRVERFRVVGS